MTEKISVSNDELYNLLLGRGYRIIVDSTSPSTTKSVVLTNMHSSAALVLTRTYNPDWTRKAIIEDCLDDLLKWSGLRLIATLDY